MQFSIQVSSHSRYCWLFHLSRMISHLTLMNNHHPPPFFLKLLAQQIPLMTEVWHPGRAQQKSAIERGKRHAANERVCPQLLVLLPLPFYGCQPWRRRVLAMVRRYNHILLRMESPALKGHTQTHPLAHRVARGAESIYNSF